MDIEDWTDEAVAASVLTRLKERGLVTLRDQAAEAPVSRGTLARWRKNDFSMKPATKMAALEWLEALPVQTSPSYADGMRAAVERMEGLLSELRGLLAQHEAAGGRSPELEAADTGEVAADAAPPRRSEEKKQRRTKEV